MKMRCCAMILVGLSVALPAAAYAQGEGVGSSQFSIGIVGYVPAICRASVDSTIAAPVAGTVQLGTLHEFCNSPNGYRVYADYSASLAGGAVTVDGVAVPLNGGGSTLVSQSAGAAIENHAVTLELPEGVKDGTVSFRIEAQ
ncbi:MAG: hypothetical protein RIQ99_1379 [Pseudomonadota bacterium]